MRSRRQEDRFDEVVAGVAEVAKSIKLDDGLDLRPRWAEVPRTGRPPASLSETNAFNGMKL